MGLAASGLVWARSIRSARVGKAEAGRGSPAPAQAASVVVDESTRARQARSSARSSGPASGAPRSTSKLATAEAARAR